MKIQILKDEEKDFFPSPSFLITIEGILFVVLGLTQSV